MFLVEDKASAIALMIVALWCLGSWPAFFNVLERRGRLPQHTYLDYAISTYLTACVFCLILGEVGVSSASSPSFIDQLGQNNLPSVVFAMLGGVALCSGNISMQYSLALVGISLTEVVSASLAVVGGTSVNYFLDRGLNKASFLFPGVGCFLIAVVIGSFCHASNEADIRAKFAHTIESGAAHKLLVEGSPEKSHTNWPKNTRGWLKRGKTAVEKWMPFVLKHAPGSGKGDAEKRVSGKYEHVNDRAPELGEYEAVPDKAPKLHFKNETSSAVGSAVYLEHLEEVRAIKVRGHSVMLGLSVAFFTGACYALFSPLFNLATNDQIHLLEEGVPHLSVYVAFFYFSTAFFVLSMIVQIYLLYHPMMGLPKSSFTAYLKDWGGRHHALLAGFVCSFGNVCQFMGGEAAGYAAASAVQALPLVGTFWGVVLFGEYHRSSRKTYTLLGAMLLMFMVAVVIIMASATQRS